MIGTAIGTLMLIGVIAIMVMRFYNQDIVPMKNNRMWMNTAAYVGYFLRFIIIHYSNVA